MQFKDHGHSIHIPKVILDQKNLYRKMSRFQDMYMLVQAATIRKPL